MPGTSRHCVSGASILRSLLLCAPALTFAAGCQTVRNVVDPLNITGGQPPVRIGVTRLEFSPPPLLLPKNALLQDDLFYYLRQPISFDLMTPRQIRVHLGTGRLRFAMVSAQDYAAMGPTENAQVLAAGLNEHGRTWRKGLIVVGAKSEANSLADLKNKRFHYLPAGSALNEAAMGAILDAGGIQKRENEGLLLGLDTHHISSLEVAKSVVIEDAAGIIDEADYAKWKKTGGSVLLLSPSQDEVRVIAETVRVPEGPVLVSRETPPELVESMRTYLLEILPKHPFVLASIGCSGFSEEISPADYEPFRAVYRRLHPESEPAVPATLPSTDPGGPTEL